METMQEIQERRQRIVQEMLAMRSMRRGTLNEQYLPVPQKGKKEPVSRGPYYVLSRKEDGRTVSKRIPTGEVEQVREDIRRYERFLQLSRQFAEVTQRLGELERGQNSAVETLKKTRKSPSRRTRK